MTNYFQLTRKSVMGVVAASLVASTALVGSMALLPPPLANAEAMQAIDPTRGFSELVERVMPAVVDVEVKIQNAANENGGGLPGMDQVPEQFREFFEQFPQFRERFGERPNRSPRGMAQGSGFVISADGYVVTNNHVVSGATEVILRFSNQEEEYFAEIIGTDPKTDLALLKIKSDKTFPFVTLSKAEAKVGDWVMAVGNPFGLGGTVTSGIISARGRDIGSGPYDDFLQIDASINRGNSGGPAFNLEGEVIGVNTAIFSPSGGSVGIGFAIPASMVNEVIDSLKTKGSVTRGWLGVRIQPVTAELAEGLGLDGAKGAVVSELTEASPALKAGIKQGDTILKVDDKEISSARDLSRTIAKVEPGKEVKLSIIRDGKPETVTVAVGELPNDMPQMAKATSPKDKENLASLGLKIAPADDGAGVKVLEVEPDSPAAERGVRVGDVILEVAGVEVNNPDDVAQALKTDGNKRVLMLLKSGEDQRFVALPRQKG